MSGYIGPAPVPQATQTREAFTATSGQTTFNTGGYTAGFIDVYLNGVKLAAADYTATNGSDVVLAVGAAADDILETVAYSAFTVADQGFTGTTTTEDLTVTGAFTSQGIDDNATSTAMTLDASGNVLVGKTVNDDTGAGFRVNSNFISSVGDGAISGYFHRLTSDGDIVQFRKDGTTVGSIASRAGVLSTLILDPRTPAAGAGAGIGTTVSKIVPADTSGLTDARNDLGDSGNRWKDLYLSGGVYLGGTGSSNKLTDYETGTWTPTLTGQTTTGTPTYSVREGWYVKVGNMVTVSCVIELSALGGVAGDLRIKNLPFNSSATFNTNSNVGPLRLNGVTSEPDGFCVIVIGGQSEVAMRSINANSDTNLLGSNLTHTTGLGFQVSYRTA